MYSNLLLESVLNSDGIIQTTLLKNNPLNATDADLTISLPSCQCAIISTNNCISVNGVEVIVKAHFVYQDGSWKNNSAYTSHKRVDSPDGVSLSAKKKICTMFLETLNNVFNSNIDLFDEASNACCERELQLLTKKEEKLNQEIREIQEQRKHTIDNRAKEFEMIKDLIT